jgi:hypothetical protein
MTRPTVTRRILLGRFSARGHRSEIMFSVLAIILRPDHGAVMHMQLAGNRANAPFLDMIIAQDLRLQIGRDGHAVLLGKA